MSEFGYFHPDRGYWQTIGEPSEDVLSSYPSGTVTYPLKPGQDYQPTDGGWIHVAPDLPPTVAIVYAVHLWERLSEPEADQVNQVMQRQSIRVQNIFRAANSFRSDHELWPLLQQIATELFGKERAAQLLAPSDLTLV